MRILISGSTGFIGSALSSDLRAAGHQIVPLVRKTQPGPNEIAWDPASGKLDNSLIQDFDAVIHLSGENIAGRRWTAERKRRIRESRILGTRLLAGRLAGLSSPPRIFISASAIGYYGDRGEEILREDSPPGKGFLAQLCQEWEQATQPAKEKGIRVISPRIGTVLDRTGGALQKMLLPFRFGLGGPMGNGRQFMSWISLDDLVGALAYCLDASSLEGAVNAVAPAPVTNREFAKALGRVLRRPAIFPLPAFVLKTLLGEMAKELLLSSARLEPAKLMASGYCFKHPTLDAALRDFLTKR